MKKDTALNPFEMGELCARGVDISDTDMLCLDFNGTYAFISGEDAGYVAKCAHKEYYAQQSGTYSLSGLLNKLPSAIIKDGKTYSLIIDMGGGVIGYERHEDWELAVNADILHQEFADTLLPAAFQLLKWCAENDYINLRITEKP